MRRYIVTVGAGGKPQEIPATKRSLAAKRAIDQHDKAHKGAKKANGQRDKVGWPLLVNIVRVA
jgi:hypothetical protein